MFRLQSLIADNMPEVKALVKKYNRPAAELEKLENEVRDFCVRVPLLGHFNAGKSSLVNTLIGHKLLAVEINPETALPTEIRYGETELFTASLGENSIRNITRSELMENDFRGEEKILHVYLPDGNLKAFPHLCIVDMPGWDSGIKAHSRAIDDYIDSSLAYFLVIDVDEGTLHESMFNVLSELNLHEMPVTVLISKIDKKPAVDSEAVVSKIRSEVSAIMKNTPFEMAPVSSRKKNIQGFIDALAGLESRAEAIFAGKCGRAFMCELQELGQYISILLNRDNLDSEQIAAKIADLESEVRIFEEKLGQESRFLSEQVGPCAERILMSVESELKARTEHLASAVLNNGDIQGIISHVVREAVIRGMKSEFHQKLQRYFSSIEKSIPPDLASGFSYSPDNRMPAVVTESSDALKNAIKSIMGILIMKIPFLALLVPVIFEIIDFFFSGRQKEAAEARQKENIRQQIIGTLIPDVVSRLRTTIVSSLEQQVESAKSKIEETIRCRRENMESGLKALAEELKLSQSAFEEKRRELMQDQERTRQIIALISSLI